MKPYVSLFFLLAMAAMVGLTFIVDKIPVFYLGMIAGAVLLGATILLAFDIFYIDGRDIKWWANEFALRWVCRGNRTREWGRMKILRFFLWGIRKVQKKPPAILPRLVPEPPEVKKISQGHYAGVRTQIEAQSWWS